MTLHQCSIVKTIQVIRLGRIDDASVLRNALFVANQVQDYFRFEYNPKDLIVLDNAYRLAGGSYDLSKAAQDFIQRSGRKRSSDAAVIISDEAMGDPDHPEDPDWIYFSSQEVDDDPYVSVVSASDRILSRLNDCTYERYIVMMLGTFLATTFGNLAVHNESRNCALDYCEELEDANRFLNGGSLCRDCERALVERVSSEAAAAIVRLLNKAAGRVQCFVAMPIGARSVGEAHDPLAGTYAAIRQAVLERNPITHAEGSNVKCWDVRRSDEVLWPRLLTDRIYREIRASTVVVADLTYERPNVMYEIGIAHALGRDLVLLTQGELPFDVHNVHAITYVPNNPAKLVTDLRRALRGVEP